MALEGIIMIKLQNEVSIILRMNCFTLALGAIQTWYLDLDGDSWLCKPSKA